MPPPGARGSHWEIEGMDGYLSGDQLTLYNDGGSYQIEEVYTEVDGEQVLDHVRIESLSANRMVKPVCKVQDLRSRTMLPKQASFTVCIAP